MNADPRNLPVRPGVITLARHGEPSLSRRVRLSAQQYREFWTNYEALGIRPGQTPPSDLVATAGRCEVVLCSSRLRAIESAGLLTRDRDFERDAMFIEAPLPPPEWPAWIRLSPPTWGFLARLWWLWFDHNEGQETAREANRRAEAAAARLTALADGGQDVLLIAHGWFNHMLGKALRRSGWRRTAGRGFKYWSMRRYERG